MAVYRDYAGKKQAYFNKIKILNIHFRRGKYSACNVRGVFTAYYACAQIYCCGHFEDGCRALCLDGAFILDSSFYIGKNIRAAVARKPAGAYLY